MTCCRGGKAQQVDGVAVQGGAGTQAPRSPVRDTGTQRALRPAWTGELGAVTAEVAVVLPALAVLLALLLGVAHLGAQQLQLEEAARAGAREVVRGESEDSVHRTTQRLAGPDAVTTVTHHDGWSTVEVRATAGGPVIDILGVQLTASATGKGERHGQGE